jgi:hypothetical protein
MAILVQSNKKPNLTFPTLTGSIVTFNSQYAGLPLKACKVNIPVTQEGTGDPSPDNIRDFIGVSGVSVSRTGKNLLDDSNVVISGYNIWFYGNSSTYKFWKAGTYMCSAVFSSAGISINYTLQGNSKSSSIMTAAKSGLRALSFTLPKDGYYRIFAQKPGGISADDVINPMIAISNDLTYEPYTGNTYQITFGQTVYGGEYDARTGVLTITHGFIASYNGETINEPWISSMDKYIEGTTPTNGAQVVYPLATPQIIQLPPCPIDTLQGINNIWADTGNTTASYIKIQP